MFKLKGDFYDRNHMFIWQPKLLLLFSNKPWEENWRGELAHNCSAKLPYIGWIYIYIYIARCDLNFQGGWDAWAKVSFWFSALSTLIFLLLSFRCAPLIKCPNICPLSPQQQNHRSSQHRPSSCPYLASSYTMHAAMKTLLLLAN
jgi:hypothetical protein